MPSPIIALNISFATVVFLLAGCAGDWRTGSTQVMARSTDVAPPTMRYRGEAPTVTTTPEGTTYSTTGRLALLDIDSESRHAIDPDHFFDENPDCRERPFHYRYSFMLVKGSVTLRADRTLVLDTGELYIASRIVDDQAVAGPPVILPLLFPLVKKKAVQAGSVSTEYVVRAFNDIVELSFRSSSGPTNDGRKHGVWIVTDADLTRACKDVSRYGATSQNEVTTLNDDGTNHVSKPIDNGQDARFALLRTWAHDLGVHD